MLPNFLCLGTAKAGTTTLHDILSTHPDIYLPKVKETKYFAITELYQKGKGYYEETYFKTRKNEDIIGEIDPDYMYREYVPYRILETLGSNIKLLFVLRNPVDRAYSHYLMNVRQGWETLSFEDAVRTEEERTATPFGRDAFSYIDRGFYFKQINRFMEYFSPLQMKFIIFEDFVKNIPVHIEDICCFLGADYHEFGNFDFSRVQSNRSSKSRSNFLRDFIHNKDYLVSIKRAGKILLPSPQLRLKVMRTLDRLNLKPLESTLSPEIRDSLMILYDEDIQALQRLTGLDLGQWTSSR